MVQIFLNSNLNLAGMELNPPEPIAWPPSFWEQLIELRGHTRNIRSPCSYSLHVVAVRAAPEPAAALPGAGRKHWPIYVYVSVFVLERVQGVGRSTL